MAPGYGVVPLSEPLMGPTKEARRPGMGSRIPVEDDLTARCDDATSSVGVLVRGISPVRSARDMDHQSQPPRTLNDHMDDKIMRLAGPTNGLNVPTDLLSVASGKTGFSDLTMDHAITGGLKNEETVENRVARWRHRRDLQIREESRKINRFGDKHPQPQLRKEMSQRTAPKAVVDDYVPDQFRQDIHLTDDDDDGDDDDDDSESGSEDSSYTDDSSGSSSSEEDDDGDSSESSESQLNIREVAPQGSVCDMSAVTMEECIRFKPKSSRVLTGRALSGRALSGRKMPSSLTGTVNKEGQVLLNEKMDGITENGGRTESDSKQEEKPSIDSSGATKAATFIRSANRSVKPTEATKRPPRIEEEQCPRGVSVQDRIKAIQASSATTPTTRKVTYRRQKMGASAIPTASQTARDEPNSDTLSSHSSTREPLQQPAAAKLEASGPACPRDNEKEKVEEKVQEKDTMTNVQTDESQTREESMPSLVEGYCLQKSLEDKNYEIPVPKVEREMSDLSLRGVEDSIQNHAVDNLAHDRSRAGTSSHSGTLRSGSTSAHQLTSLPAVEEDETSGSGKSSTLRTLEQEKAEAGIAKTMEPTSDDGKGNDEKVCSSDNIENESENKEISETNKEHFEHVAASSIVSGNSSCQADEFRREDGSANSDGNSTEPNERSPASFETVKTSQQLHVNHSFDTQEEPVDITRAAVSVTPDSDHKGPAPGSSLGDEVSRNECSQGDESSDRKGGTHVLAATAAAAALENGVGYNKSTVNEKSQLSQAGSHNTRTASLSNADSANDLQRENESLFATAPEQVAAPQFKGTKRSSPSFDDTNEHEDGLHKSDIVATSHLASSATSDTEEQSIQSTNVSARRKPIVAEKSIDNGSSPGYDESKGENSSGKKGGAPVLAAAALGTAVEINGLTVNESVPSPQAGAHNTRIASLSNDATDEPHGEDEACVSTVKEHVAEPKIEERESLSLGSSETDEHREWSKNSQATTASHLAPSATTDTSNQERPIQMMHVPTSSASISNEKDQDSENSPRVDRTEDEKPFGKKRGAPLLAAAALGTAAGSYQSSVNEEAPLPQASAQSTSIVSLSNNSTNESKKKDDESFASTVDEQDAAPENKERGCLTLDSSETDEHKDGFQTSKTKVDSHLALPVELDAQEQSIETAKVSAPSAAIVNGKDLDSGSLPGDDRSEDEISPGRRGGVTVLAAAALGTAIGFNKPAVSEGVQPTQPAAHNTRIASLSNDSTIDSQREKEACVSTVREQVVAPEIKGRECLSLSSRRTDEHEDRVQKNEAAVASHLASRATSDVQERSIQTTHVSAPIAPITNEKDLDNGSSPGDDGPEDEKSCGKKRGAPILAAVALGAAVGFNQPKVNEAAPPPQASAHGSHMTSHSNGSTNELQKEYTMLISTPEAKCAAQENKDKNYLICDESKKTGDFGGGIRTQVSDSCTITAEIHDDVSACYSTSGPTPGMKEGCDVETLAVKYTSGREEQSEIVKSSYLVSESNNETRLGDECRPAEHQEKNSNAESSESSGQSALFSNNFTLSAVPGAEQTSGEMTQQLSDATIDAKEVLEVETCPNMEASEEGKSSSGSGRILVVAAAALGAAVGLSRPSDNDMVHPLGDGEKGTCVTKEFVPQHSSTAVNEREVVSSQEAQQCLSRSSRIATSPGDGAPAQFSNSRFEQGGYEISSHISSRGAARVVGASVASYHSPTEPKYSNFDEEGRENLNEITTSSTVSETSELLIPVAANEMDNGGDFSDTVSIDSSLDALLDETGATNEHSKTTVGLLVAPFSLVASSIKNSMVRQNASGSVGDESHDIESLLYEEEGGTGEGQERPRSVSGSQKNKSSGSLFSSSAKKQSGRGHDENLSSGSYNESDYRGLIVGDGFDDNLFARNCFKSEKFKDFMHRVFPLVAVMILISIVGTFMAKNELDKRSEKEPSRAPFYAPTAVSGTPSLPPLGQTPAPSINFEDKKWQQLGVVLQGANIDDEAGFSVSQSEDGTRIAVGARRSSLGGIFGRGSVIVFTYVYGVWEQSGEFFGADENEQHGFDVALSGDGKRLAIGCVGNDQGGKDAGRVDIYEDRAESGGTWVRVGELVGENELDLFGFSVSLSRDGSMIGVGAPFHASNGVHQSGSAYVYRDEGVFNWKPVGKMVRGTTIEDYFGWSVSISGDGYTLAVGAPLSSGRADTSGYVRVYKYVADEWDLYGDTILGGEAADRFGFSVSLSRSGELLGVGSFRSSINGRESGSAAVYENDGAWKLRGDALVGEEGSAFGFAVALSSDGSQFVVGAPKRVDESDSPTGLVRAFRFSGDSWVSSRDLVGAPGDNFGYSVTTSGKGRTIGVGVPDANEARVYA